MDFFSTGSGDPHSHNTQIGFNPRGMDAPLWEERLNIDFGQYFADPVASLAADSAAVVAVPYPVLQRREGEIIPRSSYPLEKPDIRMNYFTYPYDLKVMVAVMSRTLEIMKNWPGPKKPGAVNIPPLLAAKHGYEPGKPPSDALLENIALHYSTTVSHLCCTYRIGDVVDPTCKLMGIGKLQVEDASVIPDIISENNNPASILIGEKAAEMITREHGNALSSFVGG